MPLHTIAGLPVFIHELQSVMLISMPDKTLVGQEAVQTVVNKVVADRDQHASSKYQIQDPTLGFDVFIRHGSLITSYSFTAQGEFISEPSVRRIEEDGLFHFQFTHPSRAIESFAIKNQAFKISPMTTEKFFAEPLHEQSKILNEIIEFSKINFPEHFELWDLNSKGDKVIMEHFKHLLSSLSSLYIIRDNEDKIVAINGISATPDGLLIYQSMTITRIEDRDKGFMAINLAKATQDYPNAVMSAYFVNQKIRAALGEISMTKSNCENLIPARSSYLETKLAAITPLENLSTKPDVAAVQSQMRKEINDIRHSDDGTKHIGTPKA